MEKDYYGVQDEKEKREEEVKKMCTEQSCFVLVCSLDQKDSVQSLNKILSDIIRFKKRNSFSIVFVINKIDLKRGEIEISIENAQISIENLIILHRLQNASIVKTSALKTK